jgi:hypothetical protein
MPDPPVTAPLVGTRTTGDVRKIVDPRMTTLPLDAVMVWCMTGVTGTETAPARRMTTAIKVNALAMVIAIGAIVWQIAAGVDYRLFGFHGEVGVMVASRSQLGCPA